MEQYFKDFLRKMKNIEENLIIFLESPDKLGENFDIFSKYLQDQKLVENKYEMEVFLYLIIAISNYYHRANKLFTKIELLIRSLKDKIQNYFTSFEIFHIFQSNKRFLLFLFNLGIITPTEEIYYNIISNTKYLERKYLDYFYPEFELYMNDDVKMKIQKMNEINIKEFNKKRENGQNDNYLCKLIQDDSVIDFEKYLTNSKISPSSSIPASIYETNLFLISKNPTLIEYSAFCGSIQIFKYLINQNIKLTSSIWPYAVHGRNSEIIHYLEERKVIILCNLILCIESIKSHNNELYNYLNVHISKREKIFHNLLLRKSLKHYNFIFFTEQNIDILIELCKSKKPNNFLYYLCKYDYFSLVDFLCKSTFVDVNFQYFIYKPFFNQCQKNIFLYLTIKNCDYNHGKEKKDPIERSLQIQRKYSIYKYDNETSTILHISIRKGNLDIIKLLLTLPKLNLNIKSTITYKKPRTIFDENFYYVITQERTILNEAIDCGCIEVFQLLIKNDCFNDFNDFKLIKSKLFINFFSPSSEYYERKIEKTLLHQAIQKGNNNIIKLIINKQNVDVNQKSISKIMEEGEYQMVFNWKRTIEKSSLYYAVKCSNIKIVQLLVEKKNIDINVGIIEYLNVKEKITKIQEKSPLYLAIENGNLKMVKLLLKHPKINAKFESTFYVEFHIFMYYNYEKAIQKNTILQIAEKKNLEIFQLLTNFLKNFKK